MCVVHEFMLFTGMNRLRKNNAWLPQRAILFCMYTLTSFREKAVKDVVEPEKFSSSRRV